MRPDTSAAARFLGTGYAPTDRVALLLKSVDTSRTRQHVTTVARLLDPRYQRWLHALNAGPDGWDVYVSVNAIAPGKWRRTREDIGVVRHVFLDVDTGADVVMNTIMRRLDLPFPSYIVRSSPGRLHLLWRVQGIAKEHAEPLQRQLARELGADGAATACSQLTRLPGFLNRKYQAPHVVTVDYAAPDRVFTRDELPDVSPLPAPVAASQTNGVPVGVVERARQYLGQVEPAIAGQHGNQRTFRVACHLVRGFALSDVDAMSLLAEWNRQCEPPWSVRELEQMLRNARRYGREPIGGLLRPS